MKSGNQKRQEKYQQDLAADGSTHFVTAHAYFLHDLETLPILVAFGDLLIVNDQCCGEQEHKSKDQPKEQESAIHTVKVVHGIP